MVGPVVRNVIIASAILAYCDPLAADQSMQCTETVLGANRYLCQDTAHPQAAPPLYYGPYSWSQSIGSLGSFEPGSYGELDDDNV